MQLVLEPDAHPAVKPYQDALVQNGIPVTSFADVRSEFQRLRKLGVQFTQGPTDLGQVATAVLDDSCGNLIQLTQLN